VVRTRVGYAGGKKKDPTYYSLGDHSETVQIDYDPTQISYEELLTVFWKSHSPTSRSWSRQYMAAIFYHNAEQRKLAVESRNRKAVKRKGKIYTEISSFTGFYLAEPYHQKYWLRQDLDLMKEFSVMYPNNEDFVNSTAAARLNGYLGGYGKLEDLQLELGSLGLVPASSKKLLDFVRGKQQ
jgi:peptide-methionine (S)-S-oxide reductase